eukprot:TRINITY_DN23130_c0_g2_i1.p1 TRINITY_DN23130_c0_g2~~TRINITY_DN23130_c0_g2_i1.p1  ORF type:complete len:485 (+),score=97.44 TRINITY_DN23130_c0_g2_i1:106-1455(+)
MALSKPVPPGELSSGREDSSPLLHGLKYATEPFSGWLLEPSRLAAPFAELYEDLAATGESVQVRVLSSVADLFSLIKADSDPDLAIEQLLARGAFGAVGSKSRRPLASCSWRRSLEKLFLEPRSTELLLAREASFMCPVLLTATFVGAPVSPWVAMCSLSPPAQYLQAAAAAGFGYFAYAVMQRFNGSDGEVALADRRILKRAAMITAFACGAHAMIAVCAGAPVMYVPYFTSPLVAFLCAEEIVTQPMVFLNLGYLAGMPSREIIMPLTYALGSAAANLASVSKWVSMKTVFVYGFPVGGSWICLGISAGCVYMVAQKMNQLHMQALAISEANMRRVKLTGDLLVFAWSLYPVLQAGRLLGILDPELMLLGMTAVDFLSKVGASHTMTRERYVLDKSAQRYGGDAPALQQAPRPARPAAPPAQAIRDRTSDQEPCSEPDCRSQEDDNL